MGRQKSKLDTALLKDALANEKQCAQVFNAFKSIKWRFNMLIYRMVSMLKYLITCFCSTIAEIKKITETSTGCSKKYVTGLSGCTIVK